MCPLGSLRDKIYNVKSPIKESFVKKYGSTGAKGSADSAGLSPKDVAAHGRQVLEALKFLLEKGIPYSHLHSGNVLIKDDGQCALTDLENGILGPEALYSPHVSDSGGGPVPFTPATVVVLAHSSFVFVSWPCT